MSSSIISVLSDSNYLSLEQLIIAKQSLYPKKWFYKPIGMEVEITNKCNIRCAGCGQRDEHVRPRDDLSVDEYVDSIHQAKDAGVFAFSLTGGETLLFLDKIKKIISAAKGIDIYKINTNGFWFVNDAITLKVLSGLKESGFGVKNKYIKPVLVISVGQQNEAGIPLTNAVNLVKNFYKIFDFDQAICSVNITDKNIQTAHSWMQKLKLLYKQQVGKNWDEEKIPIRKFMLNNMLTLERLKLVHTKKVKIRKLLSSYKHIYISWTCLNTVPDDYSDLTTLTPKCVLRPSGDLYSCPGFNYVHKIGNLKEQTFKSILRNTNQNPILEKVFTQGLLGLLDYAKNFDPSLEKQTLSISNAPCDVCQFLTKKIHNYIYAN